MRKYHDVVPMSRVALEDALSSGAPERIAHAMVSMAYHEPDWKWVQGRLLSLLDDDDEQTSCLAATCLGHLARIHRRLEIRELVDVLRKKAEGHPGIAGCIGDALDDIEMFCKPHQLE